MVLSCCGISSAIPAYGACHPFTEFHNYEMLRRMAELAHQFIAKPLDTRHCMPHWKKRCINSMVQDDSLQKLLLGVRSLPSYPSIYMEIVDE